MHNQKKGQGLSINIIIIVIISLIVLVVIIAIFTGKVGNFSKGVEETATCANTCKALGDKTASQWTAAAPCTGISVPGTYNEGPKCCCT